MLNIPPVFGDALFPYGDANIKLYFTLSLLVGHWCINDAKEDLKKTAIAKIKTKNIYRKKLNKEEI